MASPCVWTVFQTRNKTHVSLWRRVFSACRSAPSLILADEPTGQLDSETGAGIITLLRKIAEGTGISVVIASHDVNVRQAADQVYEFKDGQLVESIGPVLQEDSTTS